MDRETKTFYISCSSKHRDLVLRVASALERMGLEWHSDWCWPVRFVAIEANRDEWQPATETDLRCAVEADLFVLLVTPDTAASFGAGAELGARWAKGGYAHIIRIDDCPLEHPFYFSRCVSKRWEKPCSFYEWLHKKLEAEHEEAEER